MVPNISENKIPKVDASVIVCHLLMPSLCTLLNLMLFISTSKNSYLKISSTSSKHRATLRVLAEVPQTLTERLQFLKTWTTPIYEVSWGFSARLLKQLNFRFHPRHVPKQNPTNWWCLEFAFYSRPWSCISFSFLVNISALLWRKFVSTGARESWQSAIIYHLREIQEGLCLQTRSRDARSSGLC